MRYRCDKVFIKAAQLLVIAAAMAVSVPAFAQFEIAPDHFDSTPPTAKKQAVKSSPKQSKVQSPALSGNQGNGQLRTGGQTANAATHATTKTGAPQPAGQAAVHPDPAKPAQKTQAAVRRKKADGKVTVASSR